MIIGYRFHVRTNDERAGNHKYGCFRDGQRYLAFNVFKIHHGNAATTLRKRSVLWLRYLVPGTVSHGVMLPRRTLVIHPSTV